MSGWMYRRVDRGGCWAKVSPSHRSVDGHPWLAAGGVGQSPSILMIDAHFQQLSRRVWAITGAQRWIRTIPAGIGPVFPAGIPCGHAPWPKSYGLLAPLPGPITLTGCGDGGALSLDCRFLKRYSTHCYVRTFRSGIFLSPAESPVFDTMGGGACPTRRLTSNNCSLLRRR